jgi:hypothetical protein
MKVAKSVGGIHGDDGCVKIGSVGMPARNASYAKRRLTQARDGSNPPKERTCLFRVVQKTLMLVFTKPL